MPLAKCANTATPGFLFPDSMQLIVFREIPHFRHSL